jgi:hypothetical protein
MVIMLSAGAAEDAGARERLAHEAGMMHPDTMLASGGAGLSGGRFADRYVNPDDYPISPDETPLAPWVALAWDGTAEAVAEADRVLRSVDLSSTPALGQVSGPDFELPWIKRVAPGNWRSWPLSWPGERRRAGAMSLLAAWLLLLLLTALALLIVVLIFQNTPPESPNNPLDPPPSGGASSSPASPNSPSDGSDSASPDSPSTSGSESGTPTPSGSQQQSPSWTPSMTTSATSGTSGPDMPTQNTKL